MIHFNLSFHQTWKTFTTSLGVFLLLNFFVLNSQAQVNLTTSGSLYTQNFDAATDFASINWTSADANNDATACGNTGTGKWEILGIPCLIENNANVAAGGAGKALVYGFSTPNAANDWVFSASFSLAANKPYKFVYFYRGSGTTYVEKMKVMLTTGNTPANAVSGVPASAPVKDYPNITNTTYAKDSIMFTPTAAGTYYIAFKAESDADKFFIAVDNFSAQNMEIPQNDLAVTSITTTSTVASCASFTAVTNFDVKVKNNGLATQSNINVVWSIVRGTTTVASNTQVIASLASNAENTFTISGDLTTGGAYTVTANVQLANDNVPTNNQFVLSRFNPLSDLTAQGANYFNGFTSLGSVGWVANPVATTTSGWKLVNIGTTANPVAVLACQRNATAANNDWIFSNCFQFVSGQTYRITYQRLKLNTNAATPTSDENLRFYVGNAATEAGMTTQLGATGDEVISNTTFSTITINYTATASGVHYFGFKQTSSALPSGFPTTGFAGTVIDNLNVLAVPNTDLSIKSVTPLNAAIDPCNGYTNSVAITVKVANEGTQSINTQDFALKYRVRNSAGTIIQAETTLASGNIAINPGADADLVATANIDMSQTRFYQVEIYSNAATDPNRLNDTLKIGYRNGSRDLTASNANYTENFDAPFSVDLAWNFLDVANTANSGDIFYNTTPGFASSGTRFLAGFSGTDATNSWASTNCLKLKAGQTYAINFKYRTTAFVEKLKVVVLSAPLPTTAGTAVPSNTIITTIKDFPSLVNSTTSYVDAGIVAFDVPADGNYFIAFNHYSGANSNAGTTPSFVLIDDVAITVPQTPAAPTALTATASASQKQISLLWTASAGATGYRIERGTSATGPFTQIGTTTTAVTYTDTDNTLALNTAYYYQVKAVTEMPFTGGFTFSLASGASNVANATIVANAPNAPTALTATASTTQKQIVLSWTASANTTGYRIERSTTTATGFVQIGTTTTAVTYTDSDAALAFNTTYFYRVKSVNGFDLVSNASSEASASVVNVAPNAPVLASVVNAPAGLKNTITWNAVANITNYRIERSTTGATGAFTQINTSGGTTYEDLAVTFGQQYHYRVIAVNAFGTVSAPSNVLGTTVTSLEDSKFAESIKVYPNPQIRNGKLSVEMPELQTKEVTFIISNTAGQEVFRTSGQNEKTFELKSKGLSKGVYTLQIISSKGQATKKIVIE